MLTGALTRDASTAGGNLAHPITTVSFGPTGFCPNSPTEGFLVHEESRTNFNPVCAHASLGVWTSCSVFTLLHTEQSFHTASLPSVCCPQPQTRASLYRALF